MSDDAKPGTGIQRADGSVTIFATTAISTARAPSLGETPRTAPPPEDPLSAALTKAIRHVNGLAVALEEIRQIALKERKP